MGNRVKEIMQQKGITIQKLAERAEVSRRTVQNLLHNDTDCTVETLRKLARAMEVSIAELLLEPHEQIVRADRFQSVQERRTAAEERGAATGEHGAVAEEHGGYKVPAKTPEDAAADRKEDHELLAAAALYCFSALPAEVQREFFARYQEKTGEKTR